MKNYFLLGALTLGMSIPLFAGAATPPPEAWVLGSPIAQKDWIKNAEGTTASEKCNTVLDRKSCDYTGPSKALRLGYEYEFKDEFWPGDLDRQMWAQCTRLDENGLDYNQMKRSDGSIQKGENPTFSRTPQLEAQNYWVYKEDVSMIIVKANKIYKINAVPNKRSSDNLLVKYVTEYSNDQAGNTRYQHTECYPYEISRCGDGVVDKDWEKKQPDDRDSQHDHAEQCDPAAPEWKNRTDGLKCSASCMIVQGPICNSTYDGKRIYTSTSSAYLNGSENLCTSGSVMGFKPTWTVGNPRIFTWGCTSSVGSTADDACNYKQYRCGDGIVSAEGTNWNYNNGAHYEQCDPAAPEWKKDRTDGKKCNSSCNIEDVPSSCGPLNGNKAYNSGYSLPRITENSVGLCGTGKLVAGSLSYNKDTGKYTWKCQNGTSPAVPCDAQDLWCGDGQVTNGEQCDPNDPNHTGWKDGSWKSCNSSCKLEDIPRTGPACNSLYNGSTEYTSTSNPWISASDDLCSKGDLVQGSFKYSGSPRIFTWSCTNDGITTGCIAYQQWCGDGKKNGTEACDPKDSSRLGWGDGCSETCEPEYDANCGSRYNKKSQYQDISDLWINKNTPGLCDSGDVINFDVHTGVNGMHVFTWQCKNHDKVSEQCRADQEWCGDDKTQKDHGEECDGTEGCSSQCKIISQSSGCNETFKRSLRLGETYTFVDTGYAEWHDRYLYHKEVKFVENHGDYNNGDNPTFDWTSQLVHNGMKLDADSAMPIIVSTPYHLITPPSIKAWNNLYIEYTVWYDEEKHTTTPSKSNLYSHTECFNYEISRCGDGEIDKEYGEECDPGDSSEKNWGNGGCDENTCTPVNVSGPICNSQYNGQVLENLTEGSRLCEEGTYSGFTETSTGWTWECDNVAGEGVECSATKKVTSNGEPKIEKTLKNKIIVNAIGQKLTWTVRVTAKGGDITDFKVQDKLPKVLKYETYRIVSNEDNLKLPKKPSGPVESGSNNIYTWDVEGTLHQGHELVIEIDSTVIDMPTKKDDYLNIACVEDDGNVDCDDAKPGTGKIEKELQNKIEVTHTGQELDWKVTVTASGGDIENFDIWDKLPVELKYTGWELDKKNTQNGVTVTYDESRSPKPSGDVNIYYWNVDGVLYSGNKITMIVHSTVKEMPMSGEDILNIACVVQNEKEIDCDHDNPPSPGKGTLDVIKTLISENKYVSETGQELKWKITVKAKNGAVELDKITDIFPAEYLEYTDYETVGDWSKEGISIKKVDVDNQKGIVTWDVEGTLSGGHTIELIVYTKVHTMPTEEVENVGCVKPVDPGQEECGTGHTSSLRITKSVWDKNRRANSTTGNSGDTITYKIEFGNYGDTGVYVTLKDFLPKDIEVTESSLSLNYTSYGTGIGSDDVDPVKGKWEKVDNVYINVYSGIYLGPNVSGVMMITGTALHSESDTHNRTNFACIYENGKKIACDNAVYNVEEGLQCKKISLSSNSVHVAYDETAKGTTTVTCEALGGKADITIYCESDKYSSNGATDSFSHDCTFEGEGSHDIRCEVGDDKNNSDCKATYQITKGTPPGGRQGTTPECVGMDVDYLNNGKVKVTCHADEGAYFRINGCYGSNKELRSEKEDGMDGTEKSYTVTCESISSNLSCYVKKHKNDDRSKDICEYNKKNPRGDDSVDRTQTCFNVNAGNFSIEEGEILAFYWNLNRLTNAVGKHPYVEVEGDYTKAKSILENRETLDACKNDTIAADSMVCTFKIYDGGNYFRGVKNGYPNGLDRPLYEISGPCLSSETNSQFKKDETLLVDWYNTMKNRYCSDDRSSKECLSFLLKESEGDTLEERSDWSDLFHSSIYYIENFGTGNKKPFLAGSIEGERGGTMSRKEGDHAYGEFKIVLDKIEYLKCNNEKWELKEYTPVVCQSNFMLTNPYTVQKTPAGNIAASTEKLSKYVDIEGKNQNFADTYLKAIAATSYTPNDSVKNALESFREKYEKLAVDVDNDKGVSMKKVPGKNIYFVDGNIPINGKSVVTKPFTFIVNGKATIEGDVKHNMMVIAKDIEFKGDCTSNQNVKGIYYASNNLSRVGVGKNTEVSNSERCTEGGLHVQGVLIGKNFENLMKASRSNINNWFAIKNDENKEPERRKIIMNGASVLIEYSPSIFTKSTMPPGAEDFVSALSIYKQ